MFCAIRFCCLPLARRTFSTFAVSKLEMPNQQQQQQHKHITLRTISIVLCTYALRFMHNLVWVFESTWACSELATFLTGNALAIINLLNERANVQKKWNSKVIIHFALQIPIFGLSICNFVTASAINFRPNFLPIRAEETKRRENVYN